MVLNKDQNKAVRKPSIFIYLASASALLGAIAMGTVLGWTSPALDSMGKNGSQPLLNDSLPRDKEMRSWIGSSMTLGALVGALSSGPIAQSLGRKTAIVLYGLPFTVGWVVLWTAKTEALVIIGRIITGVCAGLVSGTVPSYVVEISTDNVRGLLGTGFQVCITIGILLVYVFGAFLEWNLLSLACLFPGLLMSILMVIMPETPIWLLTSSKGPKAEIALKKLRHETNDNQSELNELAEQANESKKSFGLSLEQMKKPVVFKPFYLAIGLMFFQQFSGINAVMFYGTQIFKESGSSLKPSVCTIIIGVSQIIATVFGSLLVDRLGRKILLITSGVGHTVSLGVLGIYYFVNKDLKPEVESSSGWIPIVCLVVFIISFSIGFGPIPWLMIAEMTPISARSMISAVATGFNWLCAFLITKFFESLKDLITKHGIFFMFAAFCLLSIFFAAILLPETKGKSYDEIQSFFSVTKGSGQSTPSKTMPKSSESKGNDAGPHGSTNTNDNSN